MGETHHQTSSGFGLRNAGGGEIVEVQGGHIVRSTGRKDRHSKVCTAKGPRDRRVRLSAHTAIQFYDVQDRLGYDRPSKAVDWLIKKAKAAIDELAELPAWNPTNTTTTTTTATATATTTSLNEQQQRQQETCSQGEQHLCMLDSIENASEYAIHEHHQEHEAIEGGSGSNPSFLPPSLDSDSIADTIKSFFPMGASADASSAASMQFQSYPPDLLSRTSSQSQDLRLSLQALQDPVLLHSHHHRQQQHHSQTHQAHDHHHHQQQQQQVLFPGFDAHYHQPTEIGRLHRMVAWNASADTSTGSGGSGGFMFNSMLSPPTMSQPFFGQGHLFSQRGPLQSSSTPSIRAWIDPPIAADEQHHHPHLMHHPPSAAAAGIGFASGGFSGFRIPARIQGEEEHDGIANKPSSASSDSRH